MNFARRVFGVRGVLASLFGKKIIWSRVYARLTSHAIYGKIAARLCLSLICAPKSSKCLSRT